MSQPVKRGRGRPRHPITRVVFDSKPADLKLVYRKARALKGKPTETHADFTKGNHRSNFERSLKSLGVAFHTVQVDPYTAKVVKA
jgi:hypothetical protein